MKEKNKKRDQTATRPVKVTPLKSYKSNKKLIAIVSFLTLAALIAFVVKVGNETEIALDSLNDLNTNMNTEYDKPLSVIRHEDRGRRFTDPYGEIWREERERYKKLTGERPMQGPASPSGLERDTPWGSNMELFPDTLEVYTLTDKVPPYIMDGLSNALSERIGRAAYAQLILAKVIHVEPPQELPRFESLESPIAVRVYAEFVQRRPVEGVGVYAGSVWLDQDLKLIDTEFPNIVGGFSQENFLSIPELKSLSSLKDYQPHGRLKYEDSTIVLEFKKFSYCRKAKMFNGNMMDTLFYDIRKIDLRSGEVLEEYEYGLTPVSGGLSGESFSCE